MKIKALCKCAQEDDNILYLLDEADEDGVVVRQYVYLPERALFPLDGMPLLNEETILAVMDVPREKQAAWSVTRSTMNERLKLLAADAKATDGEARLSFVGIAMNGYTVRPVFWESGTKTAFVESELLKVVSDHRGLEMWARKVDGTTVFVLLNGMVNVGCILPTASHWGKREALELHAAGQVAGRVAEDWEQLHEHERN